MLHAVGMSVGSCTRVWLKTVGVSVGTADGNRVGMSVGCSVEEFEGTKVGMAVGVWVKPGGDGAGVEGTGVGTTDGRPAPMYSHSIYTYVLYSHGTGVGTTDGRPVPSTRHT